MATKYQLIEGMLPGSKNCVENITSDRKKTLDIRWYWNVNHASIQFSHRFGPVCGGYHHLVLVLQLSYFKDSFDTKGLNNYLSV